MLSCYIVSIQKKFLQVAELVVGESKFSDAFPMCSLLVPGTSGNAGLWRKFFTVTIIVSNMYYDLKTCFL